MEGGHLHPLRMKRTHWGNEELLQSLWPTRSAMPGEGFMASAAYNIYRLSGLSVKRRMCGVVPAVIHRVAIRE